MSQFWNEVEEDFGPAENSPDRQNWKQIVESRLWQTCAFDEYHALRKCGVEGQLWCSCCGKALKIRKWCMKKYCPDCASRRADELQAVYVPTIARVKWPLFVTFTIGGGDRWELLSQLSAVKKGVVKIRRQKWFKDRVRGGVGSFELKWSARGWHVHWHAVLDCKWLSVTIPDWHPGQSKLVLKRKLKAAQREIGDQWAMAVGYDPSFVFIRRARPETARYVVKYSVKPGDFKDPEMPILELLEGLRAAKLVAPWGSVRKFRRIAKRDLLIQKETEKRDCECGGKWERDG